MKTRLLKKSTRIVSWFLAVLFVVGLLPMQAQAALPGARSYINNVAGTGFGDVYLGGNYIQFGVAANGSSGEVKTPVPTANAALPGGTTPFYTRKTGNYMGFLGDADGFGVGKDLRIDYFLPGSPTEGWAAGYNDGTNRSAYNRNSVTGIAGYAFTNASSGSTLQATGTGTYNAALAIQQVISFDVNSKAVRYDITLTNNTASIMNNVRFLRQVDPDNTKDFGGSFDTITTVVNQGGAGQNAILEAKSLAGDAYATLAGSQAVLQYFSADSRARVFFGSNYDPYNAVYDTPPVTGTTVTGDGTGNMVIWFEQTNLAAGASTTFTYYAVMRATGGVVSTDPNTDYVFSANDFQFQPPNASLTTVRIKTITTVGTLYLDANSNGAVDGGETATVDQDIAVADVSKLKFKPAAGATENSNYDSFTFQVNGDTSTTYTMTVGIVITVPDAPIIGAATPGNNSASIAFTPPAYDGGSAITGYTASCTGGASTPGTGLSSPLTVTGMTNGTTYSCSVTATNAKGTSTPSGTVSVTPALIPPPDPNCTYSLSTSAVSFSASGGSGSFSINQNESPCTNPGWSATSNSDWIAITSGASGTASNTLSYTVSQNTTTSSRTGSITVTGQSNTATMTITQSALLTLSPTTLNYGTLKTSESATLSVTVTNISGSSLTISGVDITGPDSSEFTLTNNCNTLPSNGTCSLDIKFAPATAGSKTATLTVTANGISFTATLAGTADNNANPQISVTPTEINGNVDIEFGYQQSITISNTGTGTLLIQSISFYGNDLLEFTVTDSCTLILPQGSCTILLSSAYTSSQAKRASMVIASNEVKDASMLIASNTSNSDKLEITINMASQNCTSDNISLSSASSTASSGSLTGTLTVTAPDNCWWKATSNAAWITSDANNWSQGNGTVNYTVSANTADASRIGQINIGGIPYTVIQNGTGSTISRNDISGNQFEDNINALYSSGITTSTPGFYPDRIATRGEAAAFIIRAIYGEAFSYTATPYFSDVPAGHPFFKYVQKLKDDGITTIEGIYGINNQLTRAQAAALIIRAIYGEAFSYPSAPYFSDVPAGHAFFKYIQKMKQRGFTHTFGEYTPEALMPRDALAAFIAEAFLGMEH